VGNDGGTIRAGTLLRAGPSERRDALSGVGVFDTPEGLQALRRGVKGVSLGYKADVVLTVPTDRADGATHKRTRMYEPNHLILTLLPRVGPAAAVRTDGGAMEPELEKLKARMDAADGVVAAMKTKMDAADAAAADAAKIAKERADAADKSDTAGAWRGVLDAARAQRLDIPDASTLSAARKLVGAALLGKERADSLSDEGLDVAIQMAGKASPAQGTFQGWAAQGRSVQADPASRADSGAPTSNLAKIGRI
jgi:hypothetical protein